MRPQDLRPWGHRLLGAAFIALALGAAPASASPGDDRDEDAMFGGDEAAHPDEDALFGGEGAADGDEEARSGSEPAGAGFEVDRDPLAIGGQLYLRLAGQVSDAGSLSAQRLTMPNILDLYLDARPVERVRAFFNGRLRFDPTVGEGATDAFGQPLDRASVLLDQLWIKTDIARAVFLTVGQQRVKWGATRLWNPTDFLNASPRDPLTLFDERAGVPLIKVHVPIESLGWNVYAFALLGGAGTLGDVGGALRLELLLGPAELTLSGLAGAGHKTSLGADLSAGLGPFDVTAEVALSDETDTPRYAGELALDQGKIPTSSPRGAWVGRASVGVEYQFKPNDEDVVIVGAEYFYNPLGYRDPDLYPWLAIVGALQPFYLGEHYAGLFVLVPSPGRWDDVTFTLSSLGNLSDESFITRLDVSALLHRRLRLEAYAQVHYGRRGGELRFALEVPDLPPVPGVLDDGLQGFTIPAPILTFGVNLRVPI